MIDFAVFVSGFATGVITVGLLYRWALRSSLRSYGKALDEHTRAVQVCTHELRESRIVARQMQEEREIRKAQRSPAQRTMLD